MRTALVVVYVAGVVWGLLRSDAAPAARVGLALLWPVGPIAFALVTAILLAALPIAFPLVGASILAVAGAAWWLLM